MAEQLRRIFTATLIIGVSGAGKTSLLKTFAEYLWETYQKVLFLYSWDGGAIPIEIQKRMQQGLIRFWRVRTRSAPGLALETLFLATKGYVPKTLDPRTGETAPGVPLVAPVSTKYALSCPKGHALKTVPAASLVVPTFCTPCNKLIPKPELIVVETVAQTKGFETIGGVAYDGISSMCGVVMEEMDRMRGKGLIGGEKSSFGGTIVSGEISFGGNNRADVGFAHTRAQQFVNNSLSIPNLVEGPVFTALSTEGSDKAGLPAVGADLPGQAAFSQVPQWFGNICEAGTTLDENGKPHHTLFVAPFTDKVGRLHLLKTSATPFGIPPFLMDPAQGEGQPFAEFNLGKLFTLLDKDLAESLTIPLEGAPGLPDGSLEFGEGLQIEAPAALVTPVSAPAHAAVPGKPLAPSVPKAPVAGAPPPPGMKPPMKAPTVR